MNSEISQGQPLLAYGIPLTLLFVWLAILILILHDVS